MLPALPTSLEFGLAKARKDMGFGIENHFSEREEVSRREQKIEILQGFSLDKEQSVSASQAMNSKKKKKIHSPAKSSPYCLASSVESSSHHSVR